MRALNELPSVVSWLSRSRSPPVLQVGSWKRRIQASPGNGTNRGSHRVSITQIYWHSLRHYMKSLSRKGMHDGPSDHHFRDGVLRPAGASPTAGPGGQPLGCFPRPREMAISQAGLWHHTLSVAPGTAAAMKLSGAQSELLGPRFRHPAAEAYHDEGCSAKRSLCALSLRDVLGGGTSRASVARSFAQCVGLPFRNQGCVAARVASSLGLARQMRPLMI